MRVLLTTGGTGGHIFPAIAVAEELLRRDPRTELLFMGSLYGPERELAAAAKIPFIGLNVRGVWGRGFRSLAALAKMVCALPKALLAVRRFRPDVAVGFGSYAAFAPLLAARCLSVPCVLHEQNAISGASNRILAKGAASVCFSLPETKGFQEGQRTVLTGNPVRKDIFAIGKTERDFSRKQLLVFGGSLGAFAINTRIVEILPELKKLGVRIWHQTGKKDYEMVKLAYDKLGMEECRVASFINEMPTAYAWADLAVCRSGASTVAELAGAGLPAILIPFPHAAADHQTSNARSVEKAGAGLLLPEASLTSQDLLVAIRSLFASPHDLQTMSRAALSLAKPNAAASVVEEVLRNAKERI